MSGTETGTALLEAARAFRPRLVAERDRIEASRRIPEDIARELARGGFFRIFLPEAYGGLDLTRWRGSRSLRSWRGQTPRSHGAYGTATLTGLPPNSHPTPPTPYTPTSMSLPRIARARPGRRMARMYPDR